MSKGKEPSGCSSDAPHAAHTFGGRPMQLCEGVPDPKCDGKVTRATGQCNTCLAYHPPAPQPAPADKVREETMPNFKDWVTKNVHWQEFRRTMDEAAKQNQSAMSWARIVQPWAEAYARATRTGDGK